MSQLVRQSRELARVLRVDQVPRVSITLTAGRWLRLARNEVEREALGLGDRVVVQTTVLDAVDVFVKVLLDAESLRCDSREVVFERGEHADALLKPVHAPVLLYGDGSPPQLQASEDCQLVRLDQDGVLRGFLSFHHLQQLAALSSDANDLTEPLLDPADGKLAL